MQRVYPQGLKSEPILVKGEILAIQGTLGKDTYQEIYIVRDPNIKLNIEILYEEFERKYRLAHPYGDEFVSFVNEKYGHKVLEVVTYDITLLMD